MDLYDMRLPSMGGGAMSVLEEDLNSNIEIDVPTNSPVYMFFIECGYYYGSSDIYGVCNVNSDGTTQNVGSILEEAGMNCILDSGYHIEIFSHINDMILDITAIIYGHSQYLVNGKKYVCTLKLGNIETNFEPTVEPIDVLMGAEIKTVVDIDDNDLISIRVYKNFYSGNTKFVNMFKRTATELEDHRLFGILTIDQNNMII